MKRLYALLIAAAVCFPSFGALAWWQSIQQTAISVAPATYQGPGDIAGLSTWTHWGSCARAFNKAYANGTNPMCDLVSSAAPTVVICTLRVATSGFVDLSGYCPGSLTPAAVCAAAAGALCDISQVYDQTGNAKPWTNATASAQPRLQFNAANSLPGIACTSAGVSQLNSPSFSLSLPGTAVAVAVRNANFTNPAGALGANAGSTNSWLGWSTSSATASFTYLGGAATVAASDSALHALIGITVSGVSASLISDGIVTTGATASGGLFTNGDRICRSGSGSSLDGFVMEVGVLPAAMTTGAGSQSDLLNTNIHGANGYNF